MKTPTATIQVNKEDGLAQARLNYPHCNWGTAVDAELDTVLILGNSPGAGGRELVALYDGVGLAIYQKIQEIVL